VRDVDQPRRPEIGDSQYRVQFHLAQARAHRSRGEIELARAEYGQAIELESDLVEAYLGLSELSLPGMGYLEWLARLHETITPEHYLEIGIGRGHSLACAKPPTCVIAIDSAPKLSVPLSTETHIYCETSDEFFVKKRLTRLLNGQPLRLAFIDGLHIFSQALKDFINIERFCGPRSLVLIHDTIPLDEVTQRPQRQRSFYTGDVWKLVLCLKHYRPEFDLFTIATPWSGLTVVSGLDCASRVLSERYEEAMASFSVLPYSHIESDKQAKLNVVANDTSAVEARLKVRGLIGPPA